MDKRKNQKRISSLIMTALIVVQNFSYMPFMVVTAARSAKITDQTVDFPSAEDAEVSAILHHTDQLVDNGDGTFTFTSEITSSYSYHDQSGSRLKFQDGEYVFEKAGTYLIELWGGDGGNGSSFFPLSFKAGAGGKGGFVYGLLTVEEKDIGKKLSYEIGSKGLSETRSITGGGTNGDGGGAGDIAVFSVGAGGGYSAVYLLEADESIDDIKRNDPSKVLMIAGGGGGGGAGAALHTLPGLFGGEGKANGGKGGTFKSSLSGKADITPNFTEDSNAYGAYIGTYYAGENGQTSGTKGAYVGKGGTDRPGEIVKSFIGFLKASSYPNDWQQTYHDDLKRGIGGASNFRGGGGGAGFAGGSGGMQNEPLDARNVGGGGGGSSYIGNIANFIPGNSSAFEVNDIFFVDEDKNTNYETGGAVVIRYLPNESTDYDYLNSIKVSGEVSKYFDIVGAETSTFSKTGSVAPVSNGLSQGQANDKLTLTLRIRPKAGFFGGLNVPIFANDKLDVVSSSDSEKTCVIDFADKPEVTHVNVPYSLSIKTLSTTAHEGDEITKAELYTGDKTYAANDPMMDFISGISYTIEGVNADSYSYPISHADVEAKNKAFVISAVITPKSGLEAATVGDAGASTITKKAYVRCIGDSTLNVDGYEINAEKSLAYNDADDTYDLTVDTKIASELTGDDFYIIDYDSSAKDKVHASKLPLPEGIRYIRSNSSNGVQEYQYVKNPASTELDPGYYFIQLWGGDGGNGGQYNGSPTKSGGSGGQGGYNCGYIYISEPTNLYVQLGKCGYDGQNIPSNNSPSALKCANGGGYTLVQVGDEVIIAGGGGGGTSAYSSTTNGYPTQNGKSGYSGYAIDPVDDMYDIPKRPVAPDTGIRSVGDDLNDLSVYNGETAVFTSANNVTPGRAGGNYTSSGFMSEMPDELKDYFIYYSSSTRPVQDDKQFVGHGSVRFVRLGLKGGYIFNDETVLEMTADEITELKASPNDAINYAVQNKPESFTLKETISKYFDIVGITTNSTAINDDYPISNGEEATEKSVDYTIAPTISGVSATAIGTESNYCPMPELTDYNHFTKTRYSYEYDFDGSGTVTFKLKPKDGFLGGNDVPLLESAKITHGSDDISIAAVNSTDYANVDLLSSVLTDNLISSEPVFVKYNKQLSTAGLDFDNVYPEYTGSNAWKAEYAGFDEITYEPALDTVITSDTDLFATAGIASKKSKASAEATVIAPVDKTERVYKVPIRVSYPVENSVEHTSAEYKVIKAGETEDTEETLSTPAYFPTASDQTALVVTLTSAKGYDLPYIPGESPAEEAENPERVVHITGMTDESLADMVKKDGELIITIPVNAVNAPVEITGKAFRQVHYVKFMYQRYDPLTKQTTMVQSKEKDSNYAFYNGDPLDDISFPFYPDPDECPEGYDTNNYWDWTIEKTDGHYYMGQEDIIIVGTYKPITYRLLINYIDKNTEDALEESYLSPERSNYIEGKDGKADFYDIALTKGAEYSVISPVLDGYVTDKPVISGKVTDDVIASMSDFEYYGKTYHGLVVNVEYELNDADVLVHFISCDVKGVPDGINGINMIAHNSGEGIDYDLTDDISSKLGADNEIIRITKLTNSSEVIVDEVTGTVGASAETYFVYYRSKPGRVTVQFKDRDTGEVIADEKICEIGREYGCNVKDDAYVYDSLPRAVKKNMRLIGWETADGQTIEDDTIVQGTDGSIIELFAKWASSKVTITVEYRYANNISDEAKRGIKPFDDEEHPVEYGMSYSFDTRVSHTLENYKADPEIVKGYALENKTEKVFYVDYPDENPRFAITVNVYSESYEENTEGAPLLSGGTFALYTADDQLVGEQENTNGTITWDNVAYDISAEKSYVVKCIKAPTGYGKAQITFAPGEENKDMFLGKAPVELPYAGSTPMTGYTVVGASTMLLAVFLLFVHMRSKTEEEKTKKTN